MNGEMIKMNKLLKDNLRESIRMSKFTGMVLEFDSLNELMLCWYEFSRDRIKIKNITYCGIELDIIYDVVLDNEGEVIEETDFITIRKELQEQIDGINAMFEGK